MTNKQLKQYFDYDNLDYIIKEYLGFDDEYILNNLDYMYRVISGVYSIIKKWGDSTQDVEYMLDFDYDSGLAKNEFFDIKLLDGICGIYVYEKIPKKQPMSLEILLKKNFKLEENYSKLQWQHSYALLINLIHDLNELGVLSDKNTIIDKLDKIESEIEE